MSNWKKKLKKVGNTIAKMLAVKAIEKTVIWAIGMFRNYPEIWKMLEFV